MSYAPGAPSAVWSIPSLDAGAKLTLMYLWSRADHDAQRDHRETTVWVQEVDEETPTAALLIQTAASTGTTTRAVRGHLSKLRKLGLVKTHGRLVKLTPACQSCHCGGAACRCSVDTKTSESAIKPAGRDDKPSAAAVKASLQLNPSVPSVSPSPGDDAGARPDTPSDNPAPEEHTHDHEAQRRPEAPGPGRAAAPRASDRGSNPALGARLRTDGAGPVDGPGLADHAAAIRARALDTACAADAIGGGPRAGQGELRRDSPGTGPSEGDGRATGHDPRGAGDHHRGPRAGDGRGLPQPVGPAAAPGHAADRRGAQGGARAVAPAAQAVGTGAGRLTPELAEAVSKAGPYWAQQQAVSTRFCEDVQACVDDIGLTPEELTRALSSWDTADRSTRPNRREVLWSRTASRAWVRKVAGLGGEVVKFAPLSGGAVVDTTPFWAKPGFVMEEEVS